MPCIPIANSNSSALGAKSATFVPLIEYTSTSAIPAALRTVTLPSASALNLIPFAAICAADTPTLRLSVNANALKSENATEVTPSEPVSSIPASPKVIFVTSATFLYDSATLSLKKYTSFADTVSPDSAINAVANNFFLMLIDF